MSGKWTPMENEKKNCVYVCVFHTNTSWASNKNNQQRRSSTIEVCESVSEGGRETCMEQQQQQNRESFFTETVFFPHIYFIFIEKKVFKANKT